MLVRVKLEPVVTAERGPETAQKASRKAAVPQMKQRTRREGLDELQRKSERGVFFAM
jgi:hypothetical protein